MKRTKQPRRVSTSTLINMCLGAVVVLMAVFAYFYLKQRVPGPIKAVVDLTKETLILPPTYKYNIYAPDSSPLNRPMALALDGRGNVYVSDAANNQIQVFTLDGKWVRRWGRFGRLPGQFDFPFGIAVRDNKVYVGDRENGRIQIFTPDGKYLGMIPDRKKHKDLQFIPLGVHAGPDGRLYVTSKDNRVLIFDRDDNLVAEFGRSGPTPGALSYPNGIAVDRQGRIWVADSNNGRVQVFGPDGKQVVLTLTGFSVPQGITIDSRDRVWVADPNQQIIQAYDLNGNLLWTIGERGEGDGQWNFPNAVVSTGDRVFVSDRENARIVVFGF